MREVRSRCVFYLPFGEELGAGIGGRTTAQGYSAADGLRQKWIGKEQDTETGSTSSEQGATRVHRADSQGPIRYCQLAGQTIRRLGIVIPTA